MGHGLYDDAKRKFQFNFKSKLLVFGVKSQDLLNSEYLARLMHDEDIYIITVQETHAGSEENFRRRGTIPGYTLIEAVYSNVYGIATYVKASFSNCRVL
jgi:hypothetical protein